MESLRDRLRKAEELRQKLESQVKREEERAEKERQDRRRREGEWERKLQEVKARGEEMQRRLQIEQEELKRGQDSTQYKNDRGLTSINLQSRFISISFFFKEPKP